MGAGCELRPGCPCPEDVRHDVQGAKYLAAFVRSDLKYPQRCCGSTGGRSKNLPLCVQWLCFSFSQVLW